MMSRKRLVQEERAARLWWFVLRRCTHVSCCSVLPPSLLRRAAPVRVLGPGVWQAGLQVVSGRVFGSAAASLRGWCSCLRRAGPLAP